MTRKFVVLAAVLFLFACTGLPKFSADAQSESPADGEDGQGEADIIADESRDPVVDDSHGEEYTCNNDYECRDEDPCNGEEVCNLETHVCMVGVPPTDGFVCGSDPRRICLAGDCVQSFCGDGFVDTGAGEECDPPDDEWCGGDCRYVEITCTNDTDCPDDGNVCNGEEYCNLDDYLCARRNVPEEGTVCQNTPRMICIWEICQNSICGDRFVDLGVIPPEECDDGNPTEGDGCDNDCKFSCHDNEECNDGHDCTVDRCSDSHTCVHTPGPTTTPCRPAEGVCDVPEYCNSASLDCPPDGFAPEGTACNDGEPCTNPDGCDGAGTCTGEPLEGCSCETPIEMAPGDRWDGSYASFYNTFSGDTSCSYAGGREVWVSLTVPAGRTATLEELSATDVVIHQVASCGVSSCLRSVDDPDRFSYYNASGGAVTILLVVEAYYSTETGPVQLSVTESGPPEGMTCATAKDVTSLRSWSGSFSAYTNSWTGGTGCRSAAGPEAWFTVTVASGQRLLVEETSGTDVVLHRVASCGTTTCQESTDFDEQLEYYNATGADVTLIYVVEGYYGGEGGPFDIAVNKGSPGPGYTCATAVDITSLTTWSGSFRDYGDHWSGGSGCRGAYGPEIWFTATVSGGGSFSLSETTTTDVVLHRVASCGTTSCLFSVDDPENFSFSNLSISPVTLYLIVEKYFSGFDESISLAISNL